MEEEINSSKSPQTANVYFGEEVKAHLVGSRAVNLYIYISNALHFFP